MIRAGALGGVLAAAAIAGCTAGGDDAATDRATGVADRAPTLEPGGWLRVTDDPAPGAKHHATSAIRDDGVFTIGWHNGRVAPTDAWVRSYTVDDRAPLGVAVPVNDPDASGRKVDVVAAPDGTWVAGYEDDLDMIDLTRLGSDLAPTGSAVTLTTFSVNHSTDVAVADDGGIAVVWQSDQNDVSGYVFARLDPSLAVLDNTLLDTGPSYPCPPDVAAIPGNGGYLVVWCIREDAPVELEAPDADLLATVIGADGSTVLPPFRVDQDGLPSPARPMAAVDPVTGSLLFAWHSHDALHVQHGASFRAFRADGTALTDELPLGAAGRAHYPVVEGIDGRAIVVWEEAEDDVDPARGDPRLAVFDLGADGGTPGWSLDAEPGGVPLHPLPGVNQWWPSLAVAPVAGLDGAAVDAVITWASDVDRPGEVDVYAGTARLTW